MPVAYLLILLGEAGAVWFSTLDFSNGYWQVEVVEEDIEKTAFTTGQGLYQWRSMPMGLSDAPATFQRLMELVLRGLTWHICMVYLDDILIYNKTFEEHQSSLKGLQQEQNQKLVYSRSALLSLRNYHYAAPDYLPAAIRAPHTGTRLRRKRGRRGGVRERLRRRASKPPLPSVILSNVRSLEPKMDELRAITKTCFEYRDSNLMVLTESWLHEGIPDSLLELDGYMLVRADHSIETGKKSGGGV
ncbi:hypothetical protein M9458_007777, partial [Cirrhinus mrigala]